MLLCCLIPLSSAPPALAEVWVNGDGSEDATTITAALGMVAVGGTVHIMEGTYMENITIDFGVSFVGYDDVIITPLDPMVGTVTVTDADVSFSSLTIKGGTECVDASLSEGTYSLTFVDCNLYYGSVPLSKIHIEVTNAAYDISFTGCEISGDKDSNGLTLISDASTGTLTLIANNFTENYYGVFLDSGNNSYDSINSADNFFYQNLTGLQVTSKGSSVDVSLSRDYFEEHDAAGIYIAAPGIPPVPGPATISFDIDETRVDSSGGLGDLGPEGAGIFLQANGSTHMTGAVSNSFIIHNSESGIYASCDETSSCDLAVTDSFIVLNGHGGIFNPLDDEAYETLYGGAIEVIGDPLVSSGPDGVASEGNMALDVRNSALWLNGFGIMGAHADVVAEHNDFWINFGPGIMVAYESDIYANSNYMSNNYDGIVVEGARATITNNIIIEHFLTPLATALDSSPTMYYPMGNGVYIVGSEAIVANNTIVDNASNGILIVDGYAPYAAPVDGNGIYALPIKIVNNIVTDNGVYGAATPRDGVCVAYNIAYMPYMYMYDGGEETQFFNFFISHNDVWSEMSSNNFSDSLLGYEGAYGNISADPLFLDYMMHLDNNSPCLNSGMDTGRPEYGNVRYDFFRAIDLAMSPALARIPALDGMPIRDGNGMPMEDALVRRPQAAVYDIGAQEMKAVEFSIVTYTPVVMTGLFQANAVWANILTLLPGDLPPDVQAQVDALLAQVQQNIEGAMRLTNPIAASGSLQRALALMQEIEALIY